MPIMPAPGSRGVQIDQDLHEPPVSLRSRARADGGA
jgi:hypothetical protein